jgi:hypothetical protein
MNQRGALLYAGDPLRFEEEGFVKVDRRSHGFMQQEIGTDAYIA